MQGKPQQTTVRRGRSSSGENRLFIVVVLAVGIPLIVGVGYIMYQRSLAEPVPDSNSSPLVEMHPAPVRAAATEPTELTQKMIAHRRSVADATRESALQLDGDMPGSVTWASFETPPAPASEPRKLRNNQTTEQAARLPSSKSRQLLKGVRRDFDAGRTDQALAGAREIASLVKDSKRRSELTAELDAAQLAHEGGQQVDFDSLVQLLQQTIQPDSWDTVGGPGRAAPFPGGVYVDASGVMKSRTEPSTRLDEIKKDAREEQEGRSEFRKISLPQLERRVAEHFAAGEPLPDEIRYLAGLTEIRYLLAYPEDRDVIIAGPAEDWRTDEFGRVVGRVSGRPIMQLDDLVTILRVCFAKSGEFGVFGCGIYPRAERLAQVQQFLNRSAAAGPIEPSARDQWLAELRDQLGEQDIEFFGLPAESRVAHVMVEADYRMKLIGIGLEQAAVPIPSYFDLLGNPSPERLARPLDTLRWWFTLNYDAIIASPSGDAFELDGGRVKVLSENELLTAAGQRVHTGRSDPINTAFARNFTEQFSALAEQDVNFADLANLFDLAVIGGLLRVQNIPQTIAWSMNTFLDPDEYLLAMRPAPRTVETVINHRVYNGRNILAAISGGVTVNPWTTINERMRPDEAGKLVDSRTDARRPTDSTQTWWWD